MIKVAPKKDKSKLDAFLDSYIRCCQLGNPVLVKELERRKKRKAHAK